VSIDTYVAVPGLWAKLGPSSGGTNVFIRNLVLVILCRWLLCWM